MLVERHNEGDERTDDLNESSNIKRRKNERFNGYSKLVLKNIKRLYKKTQISISWQSQPSTENSQPLKLLRILILRTS